MTFTFSGSDKPTIGVELELQILDALSLDLVPYSQPLLHLCSKLGIDRVKEEIHKSMMEVDTEISDDVKECTQHLRSRVQSLLQITETLRLEIGVTGTHPFQVWTDRKISSDDRYQYLHEKYQWLARRMNIYGLHVHVGVLTGEIALAISRAMIPYLPYLLALSANSPFWQGIDTGMHSSRHNIVDSFPFSRMPDHVTNWKEFEHYFTTLRTAGAISSLKDLYWYIRPNLNYGTIEVRVCDAMTTLWENMALVALIHCLVVWLSENDAIHLMYQKEHVEYSWLAAENQFIAARDGLEGMIITGLEGKRHKISEGVLELIERLTPISRRLHCEEELQSLHRILAEGNGADRQRRVFAQTGSMKEVVAHSLKEFRESYFAEDIVTQSLQPLLTTF